MILELVILVLGFVLLVKGADYFVDGAAALALKFKIPPFVIGMTVVAMGTSAPELAVSTAASVSGSNGMAIGNVIGSNLFNLLVVCGVCACFSPMAISRKTLKREFPFSIIVAGLLLVMSYFRMEMGHLDGIAMVVVFAGFLIWMVMDAKASIARGDDMTDDEIHALGGAKCVLYVAGGIFAIVLGGEMVVRGAKAIALGFGFSETLVGLTICAIGTSLPELVTSIAAARKNQADMALGNVIGSNIFNILLVGGLSSAISPIAITTDNLIDIIILIITSIYIMALVWRKQKLHRPGGISMIVIYIVYMVYVCLRDDPELMSGLLGNIH